MREYELSVVLNSDLEANLDTVLEKVRGIVTDNGGKIVKEDNWGKKKLAYSINKQDFGIYVFMDVELPADAPLKISNVLNITDEVLRYLLVKIDDKTKAARAETAKQATDKDAE